MTQTILAAGRVLGVMALGAMVAPAGASEFHGQVLFGGVPVPGAQVTVTAADGHKVNVVTDQQGTYSFPNLADGKVTVDVTMLCFRSANFTATVAADAPAPAPVQLALLTLAEIQAVVKPLPPVAMAALPPIADASSKKGVEAKRDGQTAPQEEASAQAADGLLVNGSVNNAATSKYALSQAFGNNRPGAGGLYTGRVGVQFENAAFDARPFSLSGLETEKPSYNRVTGTFAIGGPIRIPKWRIHGPDFFALYEFVRDSNDTTQSALVPTLLERAGTVGAATVPVNPQAAALLALYPLPNIPGDPLYNYQVPILSTEHVDAVQTRLSQNIKQKDSVYGNFGFESERSVTPNLFGFIDTTGVQGIETNANWSHRFSRRYSLNVGFQFSRESTRVTPYFENRQNVSGADGITGNAQDAMNWGPPTIVFTSGITPLTDGIALFNRNRTDGLSLSGNRYGRKHNLTAGFDFKRREANYLQQGNPRGTFTFTGAATGSDVLDFLSGIPDTSAVAFGNPDKYLRQNVTDAYLNDDWRVSPTFTLNAGLRWEYGAPITELKDRLVDLDIAPGFAAVAPVLAANPLGPLTGTIYPASLLRADRADVEPRVGLAWRPIPASTIVVRAGFGVYVDTSVYQTIALQLAQQSPLSKSVQVQNSATCPLTIANGFSDCAGTTPNTFAADANFRVGYAQTWNLSVQRDFPQSLQITATYLGVKGTRGNQEYLPNTNPIGAVIPAPQAPVGFAFLSSNGNSTREAGQLQVRRRLHNGLTASVLYTYAKAIDDDAALGGQGPVASGLQSAGVSPGSLAIAQDWRDLSAERGLSTFDQRHLVNAQVQYTSGQGAGGGTLLGGWRGRLLKEWTLATQINTGTGLPENPVYPLAVPGTGYSGSIRPNVTGAPLYAAGPGFFLNAAAFSAPTPGQWGDARRNSIEGPDQFSLNFSLARTFRYKKRYSLDVRVDSTNALNHVTYTSYVTTINNAQFGLPVAANAMRTLQLTGRLRF
jgi:hypothetical protein